MTPRIELLAPGGDIDSIKAAIIAGADAVYCGLAKFNARNRATNITFEDLNGLLHLAHGHDCKVYLTLNIIFVDFDIPELMRVLSRLSNTSIDGVIVQDLGLFHLLTTHYPGLKVHASTQLTTHNAGQIAFLSKLSAKRVNLSRELCIDEIGDLTRASHNLDIGTEVFVHGSYCISFSGICYMSAVLGASSGNRGRCSQPCRDRYQTTPAGKDYPLNLKDNSAYRDLALLSEAGVDAIKIEGRVKKFHYVYTVTKAYRQQLQRLYSLRKLHSDSSDLHKVFNRDFSDAYLMGDISRDMFSEHHRNQSAKQLREYAGSPNAGGTKRTSDESYAVIAQNRAEVESLIGQVQVTKAPLTVTISGESGAPLKVTVQTPDTSFAVLSDIRLVPQSPSSTAGHLTHEVLLERLKGINDSEYTIEHLDLKSLQPDLFVPFKELTSIRKKILFILRDSRAHHEPIGVPALKSPSTQRVTPHLSVLISSAEDVHLCHETRADLHYQLPCRLGSDADELLELFAQNPDLIPWFPSILIGEDYTAAVKFLRHLRPRRVVTNNTGIAYEAFKAGIPWIAGPHLNIGNSHSLVGLKERFDCYGAFISNELNGRQIQKLKPPGDFKLYYRIYHPVMLLTSRQCLFQQVTGCEKASIDEACILDCERSTVITKQGQVSLHIHKTLGNYASIYHDTHFMNPAIVADIPNLFSSFLIDLRNIRTTTQVEPDKLGAIQLFDKHLRGEGDSVRELTRSFHPTTSTQYVKGLK